MSEIQLQAQCYQWAYNNYQIIRKLLFHVPNGGTRNVVEGMQLKASGVVSGVPDLLLIWKGSVYAFELKASTGILSPNQKDVHARWLSQGVTVHVVRDFETFKNIFLSIIIL